MINELIKKSKVRPISNRHEDQNIWNHGFHTFCVWLGMLHVNNSAKQRKQDLKLNGRHSNVRGRHEAAEMSLRDTRAQLMTLLTPNRVHVSCSSRQRRIWTDDQQVRMSTLLIGDIDDAFQYGIRFNQYGSPRRLRSDRDAGHTLASFQ